MDDFIPGVRFGRELGRGRSVVLVEAFRGELRCLAKIPQHALLGNRPLVDAFVKNHEIAMGLDHPHLARVYACDWVHEQPYALLEWIEDPPLARITGSDVDVTRIARELAEAIAACHAQGFVLLGLSPRNVTFGDASGIRITNYELGQRRGEPHAGATGFFWGDEAVVAPEQLAWFATDEQLDAMGPRPARPASTPDERADLYAWGILIAHLIEGPKVLRRRSAMGVLRLSDSGIRLSGGHPLALAVRSATAHNPNGRCPNATELMGLLPPA